MTSTSYADIGGHEGHLANLEPFTHRSMSATWQQIGYVVYSYTTMIALYDPQTHIRTLSTRYYSPTTSRHQNLAAAWLPGDTR